MSTALQLPAFVREGYELYQRAERATLQMATLDGDRSRQRSELRTLQQRLAELEGDARLEAALATNGGGKPAYSNETARAEATRKALRRSPEACRLVTAVADAETRLALLEADYEVQRRSRANQLALLSYATAWLQLAAGDHDDKEMDR